MRENTLPTVTADITPAGAESAARVAAHPPAGRARPRRRRRFLRTLSERQLIFVLLAALMVAMLLRALVRAAGGA